MNAISRYAQASVGYTAKVQASLDLLTQTRHDHAGAWTQANSLGAEDVGDHTPHAPEQLATSGRR